MRRPTTLIALACFLLTLGNGLAAGVSVADSEEYGPHLADAEGMSLYAFLPDDQGMSQCKDACAEAWPPLIDEGEPAGEGIDASLLSSLSRPGAGRQVTYNGWPLYRFAGDAEAGAVEGQGAGFAWFLVSPEGELITAAQPAAEEAPAEDADAAAEGDAAAEEAAGAASGPADVDALMREGASVFSRVCAGCHGAEGDEALATHVEILAGNDRAVGNAGRATRRVIHGGTYMPAFGGVLSDREVAAVVTYIRNSWGNDHPPVTEEEVSEQR